MLATIREDTQNVLHIQHITPNSKRWYHSDIPNGGHKQIKGAAHMVEGGTTLEKPPIPTHMCGTRGRWVMKWPQIFQGI